jgi:sucrose-6-phosphatase
MTRYLLCTDLDRTLIPNGVQPESEAARVIFRKLAQREDITLVYVTGRHLELLEEAILAYDLPQPAYAIADVGANIYRIDETGWHQMKNWCAHISTDWKGLSHKELYPVLSVFPLLKLQEQEKQRRHKLSFYVPLETNIKALINEMKILLLQTDIRANIIWSIDEEAETGLLDVLPASANKLYAMRFLMQKKNFTETNTIYAGDSGNDVDVLLSEIPSVLVANAHRDIKQQLESAQGENLYIAQGEYLGMNGNYAGGILEGVAHYWPEIDAWLRTQE